MEKILSKLLEEVDVDIKEFMLADSGSLNTVLTLAEKKEVYLKNYQLLEQPALVLLLWQELRDRNKPKTTYEMWGNFEDKLIADLEKTFSGCSCGFHGYLVLPDCDKEEHHVHCARCILNRRLRDRRKGK